MRNPMPLLAAALSTLALSAAEPAAPAGSPTATPLDPIEVNAAYHRELLLQVVQLGLARGRSDRKEDADKIACIRDKRPGTQFVVIRCASNSDWERVASTSIARAMVGTTDRGARGVGCGVVFNALLRTRPGRSALEVKDGVLTVNARLLMDDPRPDLDPAQRMARINQLMGLIAADDTADEHATPTDEVVRFARLLREVEALDDAAAERAVLAEGFTLERYNQLVAQLEAGPGFRNRVARAQAVQDAALSL